jgi:hypothetical protein
VKQTVYDKALQAQLEHLNTSLAHAQAQGQFWHGIGEAVAAVGISVVLMVMLGCAGYAIWLAVRAVW